MDIDYKSFEMWVKEKPRRSCKIEMGSPFDNQSVSVWVYDYDLMAGQHVNCVDEIDLEAERKRSLETMIAELQKFSA